MKWNQKADEWLMDAVDNYMGVVLIGLLVLTVVVVVVFIITAVFSGDSSVCPEGYTEIRKLSHYVPVGKVMVPVYDIVGCEGYGT